VISVIQPALDGIRVVDLDLLLPGQFASRLLSDLGADVVKVEPLTGDPGAVQLCPACGRSWSVAIGCSR
jgi:crotonobetainyl-CoA:carnitine CoA-transferase CaiB-like acyl-CoA transferase